MFRIFVERKKGFQNEAENILHDITGFLGIGGIKDLRFVNRYDVENLSADLIKKAAQHVFSEPQSDVLYFDELPLSKDERVIAWEYLPGQYDQRADSAEQCLSLLTDAKQGGIDTQPTVRCAKLIVISGNLCDEDLLRIKKHLINPVDSREASAELPKTLQTAASEPEAIVRISGFIKMNKDELAALHASMSLAMDDADLLCVQDYFKKAGRDPSETEIRVLDTYWSDHCRHTTFNTVLDSIEIEDGNFSQSIQKSLALYRAMRKEVYAEKPKDESLMDMACIGAKYLKKKGMLGDTEESKEINACSVYIDVRKKSFQDGTGENAEKQKSEKWLLMFKNETHNHPTEIEPFGGAATCIGGAIRDPLSGRSWVYQSLRVTGAADPRTRAADTRKGKLPQLKITREAAAGFSSYGNQIGLATGQVAEIYHPGFEAKRMELGAVIAAAPASSVKREEPEAGDCVILVGGGTGRDGIGGATGSSKVHTETSVTQAAAEVQKGNAVEERKIQRLFRNPEVSTLIRRCNDFGAGGVAVAVGELADGLDIDLDAVPKKYEGLNGTELAVSESQERMAVVVREKDAQKFIRFAAEENLHAAVIAKITDKKRLTMTWKGDTVVDLERSFLDTAGARKSTHLKITSPQKAQSPLLFPLDTVKPHLEKETGLKQAWLSNLSDLAVCSRRGLSERFDGTVGASTVLFPMGGRYQATPEAGCAAKIPVLSPEETGTASLMAFGYDPRILSWSPWHGAQYAVLQSLAAVAAMGGEPEKCRLSFQEYFESAVSPESWGKPAAALLGALEAQKAMGTPAIGGKDSMSGTFQDIHVPPTLVSFAVGITDVARIRGGSFTQSGRFVYLLKTRQKDDLSPDFENFKQNCRFLNTLYSPADTEVSAAYPVQAGGIAEAVSKMAFGNRIGFDFDKDFCAGMHDADLFLPLYGSIIIESSLSPADIEQRAKKSGCEVPVFLGKTSEERRISVQKHEQSLHIGIEEMLKAWEEPLGGVFAPLSNKDAKKAVLNGEENIPDFALTTYNGQCLRPRCSKPLSSAAGQGAQPVVLLPVFPGTNCEYDMQKAFDLAGAKTELFVLKNKTPQDLHASLLELEKALKRCNILAFSGGFSAGDEPDGSGKFIANILRQKRIADAVQDLLENKDGLILGICNGFQALIKTGLLPYGKILDPCENYPTLGFNTIGRHISRMCTTKTASYMSPWAQDPGILSGELHTLPISHGEGRLLIRTEEAAELFKKGQVFTQYADENGMPAILEPDNPNGSAFAIEGITSPDGRILGKMAHNERCLAARTSGLLKNTGGNKEQNIFAAGVRYFR
ncbi:phosphoribosylformylglycinamidine synthase [Treponema sp. HNW]|uniref:phosphoribosylformylglycinamidine synthase n=1 Tax=Treponema sp. HNW TaxID=3116654 RepID=UPI003D0ED519